MLGAPAEPNVEAAGRNGRPGVAAGLCRTAEGGGEVLDVEASRLPGSGALVLIGRQGEVIAGVGAHRAVVAARQRCTLRPRPGLPARHRRHLHVQLAEVPKEGVSAGVTMAAALVSAFTRRPVRTDDVAMTGEVTLGGQVLPAGGIAEKVLAAHRGGLRRVLLPRRNRKQVDADLGEDLRRVVAVDYVTRVDELLELALQPTPAAGSVAALTPAGRAS